MILLLLPSFSDVNYTPTAIIPSIPLLNTFIVEFLIDSSVVAVMVLTAFLNQVGKPEVESFRYERFC